MSKIAQGFFRVALVGATFSVTGVADADYIISNYFSGTNRVRDNGSVVGEYFPQPLPPFGIDVGISVAVSPDLATVYQFTNSLGSSIYVYAYDLASRAFLPDKTLDSFTGGSPLEGLLHHPSMPLIRPSDPFGRGDLFAISAISPLNVSTTSQIKRYNRATDSHLETIDPPTPQVIRDFAFGPGNRLYMAADQGIFVYQESASGFDLITPTPLIGSLTGKLTVGPDGHLYLMNPNNANVERYTTAGVFVDTFATGVGGQSIQFGVDGNLHVLVKFDKINKYDGITGALLSTADLPVVSPSFAYSAVGRVTYVPVPEPTSVLLAAFGVLLALIRPHCSRRT